MKPVSCLVPLGARGKRRGFRPRAAARHSQSARVIWICAKNHFFPPKFQVEPPLAQKNWAMKFKPNRMGRTLVAKIWKKNIRKTAKKSKTKVLVHIQKWGLNWNTQLVPVWGVHGNNQLVLFMVMIRFKTVYCLQIAGSNRHLAATIHSIVVKQRFVQISKKEKKTCQTNKTSKKGSF